MFFSHDSDGSINPVEAFFTHKVFNSHFIGVKVAIGNMLNLCVTTAFLVLALIKHLYGFVRLASCDRDLTLCIITIHPQHLIIPFPKGSKDLPT